MRPFAGGELTIKTELDHEDAAEVAVCDTGPGFAGEVENRFFQPFVTTKSGGIGIGLSLSHSIVAAQGGRLWARQIWMAGQSSTPRRSLRSTARRVAKNSPYFVCDHGNV